MMSTTTSPRKKNRALVWVFLAPTVIGLGLFGSATARALTEMNVPLIAITDDHNQAVQYADEFTHVIEMNPSDQEALQQIGIHRIRKAVVALSKVELSIMTVLALTERIGGAAVAEFLET